MAIPGHIFGGHNLAVILASSGEWPKMFLNTPSHIGQPYVTKTFQVQNVKVEKPSPREAMEAPEQGKK